MSDATPHSLKEKLLAGDRRALAQAITLAESTRPDHREAAERLIEATLPAAGNAIRLGISGAPGVGKSTLIETLGLNLIGSGCHVAVLAVDPSSRRTGGSILGDKTRMGELSRAERAFIRPSPTAGTLGGIARRTREAILLCEAAGFDRIIVETVGVGQSETAVADITDLFCLLLQPGAGDELQGLKRGVVELAELIVVTKLDGDTRNAALQAVAEYRSAIGFLTPPSAVWSTEVLGVSSISGEGMDRLVDAIGRHHAALAASGELQRRRSAQLEASLDQELVSSLIDALQRRPGMQRALATMRQQVGAGQLLPSVAARQLIAAFRDN
jgi:LAO/AO transport system kinase